MRCLGTLIDGELYAPAGYQISPPSRALVPVEITDSDEPGTVTVTDQRSTAPALKPDADPLVEIAALLARAAKLAKVLNDADRRRARELFTASSALLSATTYLPERDQEILNRALREN